VAVLVQPGRGTQGATVTNANADAGNQWNTVTATGTGFTQTYDNAHTIHGNSTALKNHAAATTVQSGFYQWKASITATANAYARMYLWLSANPSVNARIFQFASGSAVIASSLLLLTTGALRTLNSSGSTIATTTGLVTLNAWNRIEFETTGISGSTGTVAARLYSGANLEGLTADTNGTLSTAAQAVTGTVNDVKYGIAQSATFPSTWDIWMNDLTFSDAAMPAPVGLLRPTMAAQQAVMRTAVY
jgi:hypothetical protein